MPVDLVKKYKFGREAIPARLLRRLLSSTLLRFACVDRTGTEREELPVVYLQEGTLDCVGR